MNHPGTADATLAGVASTANGKRAQTVPGLLTSKRKKFCPVQAKVFALKNQGSARKPGICAFAMRDGRCQAVLNTRVVNTHASMREGVTSRKAFAHAGGTLERSGTLEWIAQYLYATIIALILLQNCVAIATKRLGTVSAYHNMRVSIALDTLSEAILSMTAILFKTLELLLHFVAVLVG